jgi:IclR family transcriptional regulator, KDG regulon repressor
VAVTKGKVLIVSGNRLSSVATAVQILKAFTATSPNWGVTDLASSLGYSKSTVHRVLSTLTDEGLLEQDTTTGRYRLGLVLFDLVAAVPSQRGLHEAVLLPMTDLRSGTGETVQVGVLDGRQVVYVERLDSPHTLRMFTELGRRTDAHCTSSGKALLAFLPPTQLTRVLDGWKLPRKTEHTIVSTAGLRRHLDEIRRRGYAENRQESEIGVVSIAAPIRDASGTTIASLSVAGPAERMDARRGEISDAVVALALSTSRRLGFTGRQLRGG